MNNKKLEKIEMVINNVLATLFPVTEDEEERINSARVTCSRLKAFDRTKLKTQYELNSENSIAKNNSHSAETNRLA